MSVLSAKEIFVTWDGDPATWPDYTRKVRLQFEKTSRKKRHLLGAELASRLSGRAWSVTHELDHVKLGKRNGVKYLLKYLQERLCRTAVPDAGARLEDLLIRLRRPAGMTMSQWANEVQEAYRKVQRALVRARQQAQARKGGSVPTSPQKSSSARSEPQAEPPSPTRLRSPTTRRLFPGQGGASGDPLREEPEEREGDPPTVEEFVQEETTRRQEEEDLQGWTAEEWREWRRYRGGEEEEEVSSGEDLPWDELQVENLQVLPDEVLGWLLLRRANLSASSRLSVQASVQNSLSFRDIELALRDQEEELLQADAHRHQGKRRTFWVEEEGNWGLLAVPDEGQDDVLQEVHWVGSQLPPEVYDPGVADYHDSDNQEIYWNYEVDGWHGYLQDSMGYWVETDGMGTFWSAEEDDWSHLNSEQVKELEEAYAVYDGKMRTFQQSRQLQRAKGGSRGFYPMQMMKGKQKSKGKGKGKSKSFSKSSSLPSSSSTTSPTRTMFQVQGGSMGSENVMMAGSNDGCFICGDRGHGFRNCPKRNSASPGASGKGSHKGAFWIESLTPSSLIFMAKNEELVGSTEGYGVLDLGATETVASLEALHQLMALRGGREQVRVVPAGKRPFRFGNGGVQFSESFVMIPQKVGAHEVLLGIFTLDAEKVPILLGMKTLEKLGAIIDVRGRWLVLSAVNGSLKIPLRKSRAGHLLVDLTQDWMATGQPLESSDCPIGGAYMVSAAGDMEWEGHEQGEGFPVISMSVQELAAFTLHSPDRLGVEETTVGIENVDDEDVTSVMQVLDNNTVLFHEEDGWVSEAAVDQGMRDRILASLANPPGETCDPRGSHGAQEGEGAYVREVRLLEDGRLEPARSAGDRPSVYGGSHPSTRGEGISHGLQQVRHVDRLPSLRGETSIHPGIRGTRPMPQSWTSTSGCSETSRGEETREGIRGAEQPQDWLRRGGAFYGRQVEGDSQAEGRLPEDARVEDEGLSPGHPEGEGQGRSRSLSQVTFGEATDRGAAVADHEGRDVSDTRSQSPTRTNRDSRRVGISSSRSPRRSGHRERRRELGEDDQSQRSLEPTSVLRDSRSPSTRRSHVSTTGQRSGQLHDRTGNSSRGERSRSRSAVNSTTSLPTPSASPLRREFSNEDDYEDYKYDEEMKQKEFQQAIFEDEPMQSMLHDGEQCEAKMDPEEMDFLHESLENVVQEVEQQFSEVLTATR